ncbi:hypothetical protein BDN72DRAFT_764324 [Pluteus cervinus]|uniref:Uncharacterized protein n=1 Tax=Pluteus cervinus TaxID=181527 RepID=A0ACD3B199_9AGAR|nr:hypothetical protein BDN72DRAFT_764324 [Pluteus cervinus]
MRIEWASDFRPDGTRRERPPPSTMHGWLAKMRGTLSGNEKLRSEGMREMRHAKAWRADPARRRKKGQSFLAWLSSVFGRKPPVRRLSKSSHKKKNTLSRSVPRRSSTGGSKPSRSSHKQSTRSSGSRRHHHSSRRH